MRDVPRVQPSDPPDGRGTRGIEVTLLVGILLVAVFVRAYRLSQGLPYLLHPDEGFYLEIIQHMIKTSDPNPHFLTYPSFFFYLQSMVSLAQYAVARLLGSMASLQDLPEPILLAMGVGRTSMPSTILLGRWLSVGAGVGLVALTYAVGRRMTGSAKVGLMAAGLLAVSPTAIQNCRNMTADPLGIFWLALAVWASLGIVERGAWRDYLLAGASAGLAASSKYNLALGAIAILFAHLLRHGWRGLGKIQIYIAALVAIGAFFAATPYALLEWSTFLEGLGYQANHYSTGHSGLEGEAAKWYLVYLWQTEGPAMLLTLAEMVRAAVSRDRRILLIAGFSAFYILFVSLFTVRNPWTIMPMIPFALVLAASGWHALTRWLAGRGIPRRLSNGLAVVLAVGIMVVPAVQTIRGIVTLPAVDSRVAAAEWIQEQLPAGAHIAIESYSAFVDPNVYQVKGFVQFNTHPPEWYVEQGYEYLVFGKGMYGRFYQDPQRYATEIAAYDALFEAFDLVCIFPGGDYDVCIYAVRTLL